MTTKRLLFAAAVGATLVAIVTSSPGWAAPPEVTICHKAKTTLTLPAPAAKQHIAQHGDTLGPCGCGPCVSDADCPSGTVCNAADVCLPLCTCPLCAVCAGFCVP